jgi:hypothetical protein
LHTKRFLSDLEGCHVPVKHIIPHPGPNEVVSFVAFHERELMLSGHQFLLHLHSYYQIELHHLSPSEILHIVAFVTLCEAFVGIQSHFDLSKYFFLTYARVKLLPVAGGVVL